MQTGDNVFSSPAVADIDGDGYFEVACGSNVGWLYVWEHNGALKWARQHYTAGKMASPSIADIDSDGGGHDCAFRRNDRTHRRSRTEVRIRQEGIPDVIPAEGCYLGWQESLEQLAQLAEPEIPQ